VYSYLIRDPDGKVTDFTSFYSLPSSVLNNPDHSKINAAYGFYSFTQNASDMARFSALIKDALFFAKQEKFDVYNVTEVMQHKHCLKDNMFKAGDGNLKHYLYNWRINVVKPEEVGIILV
jgi:glycylpeptide N-tetradecanoyltransferase